MPIHYSPIKGWALLIMCSWSMFLALLLNNGEGSTTASNHVDLSAGGVNQEEDASKIFPARHFPPQIYIGGKCFVTPGYDMGAGDLGDCPR